MQYWGVREKNAEMMGLQRAVMIRRHWVTEWVGDLWLAGRFALLFSVLFTGLLGFSSQASWASCGHYVQDRFNPAEQHGSHDWSLNVSQVNFASRQASGEAAFPGHLPPETPQPCQGPGCRGPLPSPPPSGLALPVQFEVVNLVMIPTAEWPYCPGRRTAPRVYPESDRLVWSTTYEIIKPPC